MLAFPRVTAAVALCAAASCADRRRDDGELSGLVHTEKQERAPIDLDKAAAEIGELVRALATPHHQLHAALGPHQIAATSSVEVSKGGKPVASIADKTVIAVDEKGHFRAEVDNNRDYGRHAIFVAGSLYLRPRYGKYHKRTPNTPEEPAELLDEIYSTSSAYFDLLWTGAELSDRGPASVGNRATRKIEISKAPSPADRPTESVTQRKWRETVVVDAVKGEIVLDAATGAPLSVNLEGEIRYVRESVQHAMKLAVRHQIEPGPVPPIEPPAEDQTVSAPTVSGEVAERRKLLEGLSSSSGGDSPAP